MGYLFLFILIVIIAPEVIIIPLVLIFGIFTMFLEFVLKLFGKSFDDFSDKKNKENEKG